MERSGWRRWDHWLPVRVAAVQFLAVSVATQRPGDRLPLDVLACLLLAAGPLLLALRDRAPVLVLAASFGPPALYYALNYRFAPAAIALAVAMVSAVWHGRRLAAWLTTGAGLAGYLLLSRLLHRQDGPGLDAVVAIAAVLALVLTAAEAVRGAAARRRAEERQAAGDERLRAARDLHDVLAHQVSLVTVHANLALRVLDTDPERVRESLGAIKDVSRSTMLDLRAVLQTLRGPSGAPFQPAAGLDQLDELCARSAAAGLRVDAAVAGVPQPLSTAVDLAAYRIVQEAVTNVRRHSSARIATVRLRYDSDALEVRVSDTGPAPFTTGTGNGVAGMRERASTVGGSFDLTAMPGGGVLVRARLPYAGHA
ncbi:sensor histidine kinase [Micromonosporaceae bacterium Da 78-11]